MVKEISLTQGKVALVDDEDYGRVNQRKWCVRLDKNTWYGMGNEWDYLLKKEKHISLHRFILNLKKGEVCDHINGNGLDNRRCNLRTVILQQNGQNHTKNRTYKGNPCSSKYKGVHWHKKDNKWYAEIMLNYKSYWLGSFKNEEEAAKAYNEAAKKHFGEYARLNIEASGVCE